MTMWLRQSTASQEILLGGFLDSTDGNTQETGLTIANTDIKLWKEGATSEASKNSGGATHIANGRYYAVLDATDTNTLGKLEINVHVTGALAVRREFMVLPANVFDAFVLGTDYLDVSAVQLAGQTITAAAGVTFPTSVASPTNITAGTITTVTTLTNLPAITAGWITAAGIAASALNGKGDWNVGKTGYSLTQGFPANFSSLSITAGGLVDITQAAADKAWGTTARVLTAGTNIALAKGTGITGFNDLDAAGVATAVWNAATASYGSAGSYGLLVETNLDAQVSSVGGGSLTAAGIADAVWDELLSGHAIVGSTGEALTSSGGGGGGLADWTSDEKTVIKAVLGIPASGTTPDDPTAGILDTIRDNAVAIKAKTDALPTDPADASVIAAAFAVTDGKIDTVDNLLDTEVAAIKADTTAILVDTTDIQTRLPAALVGGRMDSNLSAISNSTATMAAFNRAVKGNVIGTIGVGSTTTSIVTSSVTPAGSVADKFKGRYLIFADDTVTANLRGQGTDITANTSAAAPTLTVTALTTAPASGDTFVIV